MILKRTKSFSSGIDLLEYRKQKPDKNISNLPISEDFKRLITYLQTILYVEDIPYYINGVGEGFKIDKISKDQVIKQLKSLNRILLKFPYISILHKDFSNSKAIYIFYNLKTNKYEIKKYGISSPKFESNTFLDCLKGITDNGAEVQKCELNLPDQYYQWEKRSKYVYKPNFGDGGEYCTLLAIPEDDIRQDLKDETYGNNKVLIISDVQGHCRVFWDIKRKQFELKGRKCNSWSQLRPDLIKCMEEENKLTISLLKRPSDIREIEKLIDSQKRELIKIR